MSAFTEAVDALGKLTPAERERILVELAKLVQVSRGGESPVHIADDDGTTVGYIFPPGRHASTPPVLTPEEEEELRRDAENPSDSLTTEELIASILQRPPATVAKS
jgi:hypothetical protein